MSTPLSVTALLLRWRDGDADALPHLVERVYPELKKIARHHLRRERPDGILQPTMLVHEAYLRLVDQAAVDWAGRRHFLAVASRTMRRLLVELARARQARKRDGIVVSLGQVDREASNVDIDALALALALERMEASGFQVEADVVQLRYLGGLTIDEVAGELGIGHATVERAWAFAKAWLHRELTAARQP